jgi:hypothetical protein
MPVRKYRSVEDMEDRFWVPPGTPAHRNAVRRVLDGVSFLAPRRRLPPGVFRFRSLEAARTQREEWERGEASSEPAPGR